MALMTLAAASIGLATFTAPQMPEPLLLTQAQPFVTTQGVVGPQGNYMTTPKGCTYRRTQAPGQPVRWIIVQNPHHIGGASSPGHCKAML